MAIKAKGMCPYCQEPVNAVVLEANTLRRDKCKCPKCEETVYVCRAPRCDNYVKNGALYDDELCPECTKGLSSTVGTLALMAAGTALTAIISKKFE